MSDNPILAALAGLNSKMDDGFRRMKAGPTAMRSEKAAVRSGVTDQRGAARGAVIQRLDQLLLEGDAP